MVRPVLPLLTAAEDILACRSVGRSKPDCYQRGHIGHNDKPIRWNFDGVAAPSSPRATKRVGSSVDELICNFLVGMDVLLKQLAYRCVCYLEMGVGPALLLQLQTPGRAFNLLQAESKVAN